MTSHSVPSGQDPIRPTSSEPLRLTVDGAEVAGLRGQSIAGLILGSGTLALRRTHGADRPRGVFCGIGVCFDCLVTVNGIRDVRSCQRRAAEGDVVTTQADAAAAPAPGRTVRTRDEGRPSAVVRKVRLHPDDQADAAGSADA